jgi:hypothetical protein
MSVFFIVGDWFDGPCRSAEQALMQYPKVWKREIPYEGNDMIIGERRRIDRGEFFNKCRIITNYTYLCR